MSTVQLGGVLQIDINVSTISSSLDRFLDRPLFHS